MPPAGNCCIRSKATAARSCAWPLGAVDGEPVVVTASVDQTARIWDASNGELRHTLEGHSKEVWGVAVGVVDGRPMVATASADRTARLWDANSGELLHTLEGTTARCG